MAGKTFRELPYELVLYFVMKSDNNFNKFVNIFHEDKIFIN